ncbi:MAG: hypothetical protein ACK5Q5_03455 [Planctomycetaceae bacterium]
MNCMATSGSRAGCAAGQAFDAKRSREVVGIIAGQFPDGVLAIWQQNDLDDRHLTVG